MSIGRFRSTAAFAPRVRAPVHVIDRATFVVFSIGGHRFGVLVERVERVLRVDGVANAVTYAGQSLALTDLASALGLALAPSILSRVLVFVEGERWVAAVVDAVHEVATIDAAMISPLAFDGSRTYLPVGARGVFTRHEQSVIVLDVGRALQPTSRYVLLDHADVVPAQSTESDDTMGARA